MCHNTGPLTSFSLLIILIQLFYSPASNFSQFVLYITVKGAHVWKSYRKRGEEESEALFHLLVHSPDSSKGFYLILCTWLLLASDTVNICDLLCIPAHNLLSERRQLLQNAPYTLTFLLFYLTLYFTLFQVTVKHIYHFPSTKLKASSYSWINGNTS